MSAAAIVGTGFMGRVHAEALARIGVDVAGVVGSSPERAAAARLGPVYRSLEELLDDARVDVVHICSPNHLHHAQAKAALRADKHVVCEKPLALTPAQAHELRDLAAELGLVNAVCFPSRFYPLCQTAATRVSTGYVGTVHMVSGHYLQDWLADAAQWNWRVDPALGGPLRVIGDIGSHWLDLVSHVSGQQVESVLADLVTVYPERGGTAAATTEDMAAVLLRFDGGARGVLTLSQVAPGRKNQLRFEMSGSAASLAWNSENPDRLWVGHLDEPNHVHLRDTGDYPPGHAQGYADAFKALFRAAYDAVAIGAAPGDGYPTFHDGLEQVLIGEAIAESARLGRWTPVQR